MHSQDPQRAPLIMIDGPDGVGKTTQLKLIVDSLESSGRTVHATRLLGGTPIGEELRQVIFSAHIRPPISNLYMAQAIYYALAEDLNQRRQANSRTIILVDRSPLSIIAYQAYGDGADRELCERSCQETMAAFQPNLVLVYQAEQTVLNDRRALRHHSENTDYFELQKADYFKRIAEGYAVAAAAYGAHVIPAAGSIGEVHSETMKHITALLGKD